MGLTKHIRHTKQNLIGKKSLYQPFKAMQAATVLSTLSTTSPPSSLIFLIRSALGVAVFPKTNFIPAKGVAPPAEEVTIDEVPLEVFGGKMRSLFTDLYFLLQ